MRILALCFPRLGIQLARAAAPELASRPLGLLAGEGDSALLAAVSVEASASGVEPGMTALQARQRCPGISFLPDNARHCLERLEAIASILRTRTTPRVAIVSRNALVVSLAGLEGRFADEGVAAQAIATLARSFSGLDVRCAVASEVHSAVCAAGKARRYPTIVPGDDFDGALPAFAPVSASFRWERPAAGGEVRERLARLFGAIRPILQEYDQSYRLVRLELSRGAFQTTYLVRCDTPIHDPSEALEIIRERLPVELDGVTRLRVTLDGAGPAVHVTPWRPSTATVHELAVPAVPIQRRLLRAS